MKILHRSGRDGIALIIVMIVIVVLGILAGGFAYSMKVETKLARNSTYEADLELLGRSGVEFAKYILGQQLAIPQEGAYTALNQVWAGGYSTNELLSWITLEDNELGIGKFSLKMIDMERRYNLVAVSEANIYPLQQALDLIGVEQADISTIVDSYLDWIDPDENPRVMGAESSDYLALDPRTPYYSKNGAIDDLSELLLIRGITPEIYYGSARTGLANAEEQPRRGTSAFLQGSLQSGPISVGLVDLFTPISGAGTGININTATLEALQLVPGIDAGLAQGIIDTRNGTDNVDGTEDDTPFLNVGELINVPGMAPEIISSVQGAFVVQSVIFEVTVRAQIGDVVREFTALVQRRNRQDITTLYFHWK
ncbi:MAG: general secretion pathway protein GspK [Verrucomicrobiota bacterium]|nr:general secretion pathway protein GspK [Verrucomicrobiota bacterium]